MTAKILRNTNETLEEYHVRLGDNLETYGLNWNTAAELLNREADEEYSESKWRKDYASYAKWKPFLTDKLANSDEYMKDIHDKTIELQKEKIRFQDQKREYNNIVRLQARFEHLKDEIHKAITELSTSKPLEFKATNKEPTEVRANVLWSDWHYGMDFSNSFNTYNPNIFKYRVQELISRTIEYGIKHKVDTLTIGALGDFIGGAIHVSTRVQASEDVIKQVQHVAETLSEAVAELSKHFRQIRFINIIGNHARLIANKSESVFTENLENIIPWYLESRLNGFSNVQILKDTDGYYIDNTFSPAHVYVHGDLDHVTSVAKNLPQMIGIVPSYVFSAHIHHDTVKEYGRTKVISNGSLIGADDYAVSRRVFAEPMQKMHIFNDKDKIEYTITIDL
ncbi:hypothetical protein [Paenibacillus sp. NAIST15-1]|uniref:hypothetical protein n=1 Tax=Paenibacillus sp. NAIST15-1 TaxID=1605994 RepID=UPI000869CB4F|nr:hypothetical protein [Paenibacillus sp. NAIST15-1]GAV11300.1 conserved domain protein [Paenibacillus sp. NAIST15-1]